MDVANDTMKLAAQTGIDRVELYTEPYARAFGTADQEREVKRLRECVDAALAAGLGVNAGHDLDLRNLPLFVRTVPEVLEVSIGHALIADALYLGFDKTIESYLRATRGEEVFAPVTW